MQWYAEIVKGTIQYFEMKKWSVCYDQTTGLLNIIYTKSVDLAGMLHLLQTLRKMDENIIVNEDKVLIIEKQKRTKLSRNMPLIL